MSRPFIRRYILPVIVGVAFVGQIAPHSFAQSAGGSVPAQEQMTKNPAAPQNGKDVVVPQASDQADKARPIESPGNANPVPGWITQAGRLG